MPKRTMNLAASMKAEEQAVKERLEAATTPLARTRPQVDEAQEAVKQRRRFEVADQALGEEPSPAPIKTPTVRVGETAQVVRDTFTLPPSDRDLLGRLKQRCWQLGIGPNKSEILRAGIHALDRCSDDELRALLRDLVKVKMGRPERQRT